MDLGCVSCSVAQHVKDLSGETAAKLVYVQPADIFEGDSSKGPTMCRWIDQLVKALTVEWGAWI